MTPYVSIFIPCERYNKYLERLLHSIARQDFSSYQVFVILTYTTLKINSKVKFILAEKTKNNPSAKRNMAKKLAKSNYIVFLDSDIVLSPGWLTKALENIKHKKVSAVVGPLLKDNRLLTNKQLISELVWESSLLSLNLSPQRNRSKTIVTVEDFSCAAIIVKTRDFLKVGGFDERFFPGEDTKLALDIKRILGNKILYDPKLIAYHYHKPLLLAFFIQIKNYAFQRGIFSISYPATSRKTIYFLPSLFVIYIIAVITLSMLNIVNSIFLIPIIIYFLLLLREYILLLTKTGPYISFCVCTGIIAAHLTYGIFFLMGIFQVIIDKL